MQYIKPDPVAPPVSTHRLFGDLSNDTLNGAAGADYLDGGLGRWRCGATNDAAINGWRNAT